MEKKKNTRIRDSFGDRIYNAVCISIVLFLVFLVAYPLWFVFVASFSDPTYVNTGTLLLYPRGFQIEGYKMVFENARVWTAYGNTILYTVLGTALGTCIVLLAGYAFSRKDLVGGSFIMKLFVFTMYFSGGTIPAYLVIDKLGLVNTRALMIILGSVSVYNIIIVRSFMVSNVSEELFDAAKIDGCGNGRFFFQIVVPLSKAVIAIMVLYIAVSHWNTYFQGMMYLSDQKLQPLQVYLREILVVGTSMVLEEDLDPEIQAKYETMIATMRYAMIVVSTLPILCVYPFIQKYFVKGVMIGSVKG